VDRLYAFKPLSGSEESVFISVGIPATNAFEEVNRAMTRNLTMTLSVTVILILAAWFLGGWVIMRPIQDLVETTQELADGNLDVRLNPNAESGEFGILVNSINEMAGALSLREREQIEAENAIREYAADLERSNRDLQDFANIASHDLQEPLRKIGNFSDILVQRYSQDLDETAQDYLNSIQVSVLRLHDFILALLNYSRLSTKTQPSERVDLNETVQTVLNDLDLQIEQADAVVRVEDLPTINADPVQMHQLFLNLIGNSLKFRKPMTRTMIDITCWDFKNMSANPTDSEHDPGFYKIIVSDNGIGFDDKYVNKIFQPFQRLHHFNEYNGSGMGLSICRKILERHGGDITAKSAPDKGATFIITYPVD